MTEYDVVVTDPDQRVALEVIRCLGRNNVTIGVVCTQNKKPLSSYSQYVADTVYVNELASSKFRTLLQRTRTLFPISTNTHYELYNLNMTEKSLLPDVSTFKTANNTESILSLARDCGINVPKTHVIKTPMNSLPDPKSYSYPVIAKLSHDEGLYLEPEQRYEIVRTSDELHDRLQIFDRYNKPILIQEFISGNGVGFSGLFDSNSNFVTGIGHRRLRELPPSGGPSTYCESIHNDGLKQQTIKLMDTLNWKGPFMVEYKEVPKTDEFYLMEINPRYWGSLPLARHAGLNIPYLHYLTLTNSSLTGLNRRPRTGVKTKFILMDLVSWYLKWTKNPQKLQSLCQYAEENIFDSWKDGLFEYTDLKPTIQYILKNFQSQLQP